jgi:hypothetical protein
VTLPALGTISYSTPSDTFTFGPYCRSHVSATPLPDRASRTTKAVKYVITVDDMVTAEDVSLDITVEMSHARKILSTRCGHLVYTGRGFGVLDLDELDINDPNDPQGIRDVGGHPGYGPVPEIIEFYPMGGMNAQAAKISWRVTTIIPECTGAKYQNKPMDFSYEVDFHIDENGYTTRTISGQLEIPATRLGKARVPSDVADTYWFMVWDAIPMLPGFRRSHSRKLSLDKRTLSFTITDKELTPTAFQEGMDDWDGEHEIGSQFMQSGFKTWQNRLSANFRVQRDRTKKDAWDRFKLLLSTRLPKPGRDKNGRRRLNYVPMATTIRNRLNSQEISFSHSWAMQSSIDSFVFQGNQFVPIPAADWEAWRKSASGEGGNGVGGAANMRGYAKLVYKPEWDAIIDLCSPQPVRESPPDVPSKPKQPKLNITIPPSDINVPRFGNIKGDLAAREPPDADVSFLAYECHLEFVGEGGFARHKPVGYTTKAQAPVDSLDANVKTRFQQGSNPPDVLQSISAARCDVVLFGEAVRVGYAVVPPRLVEIGGVQAVQVHEQFQNVDLGNTGGLSIFGGRWAIAYMLDRVPAGNLAVPTNLLTPVDGSNVERV